MQGEIITIDKITGTKIWGNGVCVYFLEQNTMLEMSLPFSSLWLVIMEKHVRLEMQVTWVRLPILAITCVALSVDIFCIHSFAY